MVGARCKTCDAPLIWARFAESNKPVPLAAEPDPNGRTVFVGAGIVRVRGKNEPAPAGRSYTSHFATCPDADQHRLPGV